MYANLIEHLSKISTFVILVACLIHLILFTILYFWSRRDLKQMTSSLDQFTRNLKHRSVLDSTTHLSDQVDAFLADVNDVLEETDRVQDKALLKDRVSILDERRNYFHSMGFETTYTIARTMIEAYPLAGVLGTILAIGAALQGSGTAGATVGVNVIVSRFGDAIWSTFAGLIAAIILMFVNSMVETTFTRLSENRLHMRDTVAKVKRELSFHAGEKK